MNELNLDFDGDRKNINMDNNINISDISLTTNADMNITNKTESILPELNVSSDTIGVELLAKGVVSPVNSNN